MSEAVGIINRAGRDDDRAFEDVLTGSPDGIAELARAVRDLVYDVLPQTVEVVWPTQGRSGGGPGRRSSASSSPTSCRSRSM